MKADLVVSMLRFNDLVKKSKFPSGYSSVPKGFFLYGGRVIQKVFENSQVEIEPKIAEAMQMVPNMEFNAHLLVKMTRNGKITTTANISKCRRLVAHLEKIANKAIEPFRNKYKIVITSKTPFTIDVKIVGRKNRCTYAEIHASNAYSKRAGGMLKQTKCCVSPMKHLAGIPTLSVPELLHDQLFAIDSMLYGKNRSKELLCQSRFVRLAFLYNYMTKTKQRIQPNVKKMISNILYRIDSERFNKYVKQNI